MPWFAIASYSLAAAVYGLIAAIVLAGYPRIRREPLFATAIVVSCLWSVGTVLTLLLDSQAPRFAFVALDAVHLTVWVAWALAWRDQSRANRRAFAASLVAIAWALLVATSSPQGTLLSRTAFASLAAVAFLGIVFIVRMLRRLRSSEDQAFSLLGLAAGGGFVCHLLVYAQAAVLDGLGPFLPAARGLASAALAPLILLAARRRGVLDDEFFLSRHVVFYAASLLFAGVYALFLGLITYIATRFGWGGGLLSELVLFSGALVLLAFLLLSRSVRSRWKVFFVKHFYRNKYDYREEWLRLTQSLGKTAEWEALVANALESLARIVGSQDAEICLTRDFLRYEWTAALGRQRPSREPLDHTHPMVKFLASTGWVIDSAEYARFPARYGNSFGDPASAVLNPDVLIVPLDCLGRLQGFVEMHRPQPAEPLNFEDHDLLKTAGKQIAVVLAQSLAQEQLGETRQFEAMNRLSAFLMHDLKNIVAQQELVIANAQHFRHRPEFIDDAFKTIRSGVDRMKKVLDQLRAASLEHGNVGRVDVLKTLIEVRSQCADRVPIPQVVAPQAAVWAPMDRDKLASVLTHLIRNAQDATPDDGSIKVCLSASKDQILITVEDNGCGMDPEFVRTRLFRPFDSTKGSRGMGIGVYQVRHLVRSAGGEVDVRSQPGVGTTFRLQLPILIR